MSLVSTWVESQEGRWYKDPVVRRLDWFICWDDDEPIELVVKEEARERVDAIIQLLADLGWILKKIGKVQRSGHRYFRDYDGNRKMHAAVRVFLEQKTAPTGFILTGNAFSDKIESFDYVSYPNPVKT